MKCRDFQFDLPLFADDALSDDHRVAVESHLVQCPLCRDALSDYQHLRTDLRKMVRPKLSPPLLESIRSSVHASIEPSNAGLSFGCVGVRRPWFRVWLAPSAIAAAASLLLGFMLLTAMFSTNVDLQVASAAYRSPGSTPVYLANVDGEAVLSPSNYARSRMSVTGESPSVNPQGALVALTKSLVRGEMKDDEVTVVADVFGNGLARIAEVIEPSGDRRAVSELQKALESDVASAPFVSADLDRRADPVRVVLKIQSVRVSTGLSRKLR